mmetsp:Transcript_94564/g.246710  ORF Transcript_94564/g.246710 Transcript_94564/m.246710 type:complete len:218 (+) Transcript_94564:162-815(+)
MGCGEQGLQGDLLARRGRRPVVIHKRVRRTAVAVHSILGVPSEGVAAADGPRTARRVARVGWLFVFVQQHHQELATTGHLLVVVVGCRSLQPLQPHARLVLVLLMLELLVLLLVVATSASAATSAAATCCIAATDSFSEPHSYCSSPVADVSSHASAAHAAGNGMLCCLLLPLPPTAGPVELFIAPEPLPVVPVLLDPEKVDLDRRALNHALGVHLG